MWIVDCRSRTEDFGLWTVDCGLWIVAGGFWMGDCRLFPYSVVTVVRTVDCGLCTVYCRLETEVSSLLTVDWVLWIGVLWIVDSGLYCRLWIMI